MAKRTWKRRLIWLSISFILGLILVTALWFYAQSWHPSFARYPLQGIDVSHHQGVIHWPSVKASGAEFAYIKATESGDMRDPQFATNWRNAAAAGMQRGAYHLYSLCHGAADQATNFIATVPREEAAMPPVVDLEFDKNCLTRPEKHKVQQDVTDFLNRIEAHSGKPAILSITQEFDAYYEISTTIPRTLWLRSLFFEPRYGARPWVMWQVSDMRRIEGISGPVDWNVVRE